MRVSSIMPYTCNRRPHSTPKTSLRHIYNERKTFHIQSGGQLHPQYDNFLHFNSEQKTRYFLFYHHLTCKANTVQFITGCYMNCYNSFSKSYK